MATRVPLTPYNAELPSASFPQLLSINTTERIPVLAYDGTAAESAAWTTIAPQGMTGTLTMVLRCIALSATTGAVVFDVALKKCSGVALASAWSWATTNISASTNVPGTLIEFSISITLTNTDSIAAGDLIRFKISRAPTNAGDTVATDVYLLAAEFRDAA